MGRRAPFVALVAAALLAACGATDSDITVERAVDPETSPPSEATEPLAPSATSTPGTLPDVASNTIMVVGQKPPQSYDRFLAVAVTDIEAFWADRYPAIAGGDSYDGLSGGVYPMWPEVGTVPGCGERETIYAEVEANAFYCFDEDFIAFDDAQLFPQLADRFGHLVLGIVMAHEWGHSIQADRSYQLQPVIYELQADCFAGAWVQHLGTDDALIDIDDDQLRVAITGVIEFRDEPGITSIVRGAHGSAFDRIGAFQDGYEGGVEACAIYESDPPTPVQLPFTQSDAVTEGNLPYDVLLDYDPADDESSLPESLDTVWDALVTQAGGRFEPLGPTLATDAECSGADPTQIDFGAALCPETGAVFVDEARTRQLHGDIGDYSVGFLFGEAWAESAQRSLGRDVDGAAAQAERDCLNGVYVATTVPTFVNEVFPEGSNRGLVISAGDLDEAVQMLLLLTEGEEQSATRALDRLDDFRGGVLTTLDEGVYAGYDACTAG